jgi:hypothetical protein
VIERPVDGKTCMLTFTGKPVVLLVYEVIGVGIVVHYTAKEGFHVAYNILIL